MFAPRDPGVLVIHVGDSDFSTDVVGDSPDSSFRLSVSALALLFIDDVSDQEVEGEPRNLGHGVAFWKVCSVVQRASLLLTGKRREVASHCSLRFPT